MILVGLLAPLALGSCSQLMLATATNQKSPACLAKADRIRQDIQSSADHGRGGRSRINGRYQCVFTDVNGGGSWNASWNFTGSRGRLVGTALANGDSSSFEAAVRGNRLLIAFSDGEADEYEIVGNGINGYGSRECGRAKATCTHR